MRLAYRKLELSQFNYLFVVEYSVSQNSVCVKSVNDMLHANRRAISNRLSSDYLPVAFFTDRDEAVEMSNRLTKNIDDMNEWRQKLEAERTDIFRRSEDKLWSEFTFSEINDSDENEP